ncbi:MAG: OprO/OprP family phosphate-selective porin, partial [Longimicrobiales bacterium]
PDLLEDEPYGITLRGTAAPFLQPRRVLHLGGDLRWRKADVEDDDSLVVAFVARSETHVDRIELYNTGPINDGSSYGQVVAEGAVVYGSFSLQGEYIWTRVNRASVAEPVFGGGYVFASVIPTGESRIYDPVDARFNGVTAARHWYGAIELLLRYSRLDLNDDLITGGAGHDWTAAANWYPHRNLRVMLNYVFTNHDAFATGDGEFLGDDDFGVFQFRLQYNF